LRRLEWFSVLLTKKREKEKSILYIPDHFRYFFVNPALTINEKSFGSMGIWKTAAQ
jgi:hypothetical protein